MKNISLENLRLLAVKNPNLWHDVLWAGKMDGGRMNLLLPDDAADRWPELSPFLENLPEVEPHFEPATFNQQPSTHQPNRLAKMIARRPRLIHWISARKQPGETGLGDTLSRLAGGSTGKKFATWFALLGGTKCGCTDAQKWLNSVFPYT